MKLMTKFLEQRFTMVGSQEGKKDPLIITKFFNPTGAGTWYASEYNPKDRLFFGYVSIFGDWNDEWGYFSLDELQSYTGRFGLGIERDFTFSGAASQPGDQAIRRRISARAPQGALVQVAHPPPIGLSIAF